VGRNLSYRSVRASPWAAPLLLAALAPVLAHAQGTSGPVVSDSRVGYVDSAIPGNQLKFRLDPSYNNRRPTRAEFFWPGPGRREFSVDYVDFTGYLEAAFSDRFSTFVEVPAHLLNPERNPNTGGLGDINAGFKFAVWRSDDFVGTFQFRTWAPTGDRERDLGNGHVSLEPGLLCFNRLCERGAWESELRFWVPVGGSDFAGTIIRYGTGLSYNVSPWPNLGISPVAEVVGWTVLDGLVSFLTPAGDLIVNDAAGDTIINAKLGARLRFGQLGDVYLGYGRPLTGTRWYENTFRVELRLFY
jgi:hypothetical protein